MNTPLNHPHGITLSTILSELNKLKATVVLGHKDIASISLTVRRTNAKVTNLWDERFARNRQSAAESPTSTTPALLTFVEGKNVVVFRGQRLPLSFPANKALRILYDAESEWVEQAVWKKHGFPTTPLYLINRLADILRLRDGSSLIEKRRGWGCRLRVL